MKLYARIGLWILLVGVITAVTVADAPPEQAPPNEDEAAEEDIAAYGLDVSFPVQRPLSSSIGYQPLGDRQTPYLKHLEGCRRAYPDTPDSCDRFESIRMLMNLRQPQSMKNYTEVGFRKIRAPEHVVELIDAFWAKHHYKGREEQWPPGSTFVNNWDEPTYLVSVEDQGLRGSGSELKEQIWAAASATLEEWTSEELQPCSLYGVRVYGEGAVMLPHVDRLPLVASAMINVAQDVDEDWPFELYDHQGRAHNVTLKPGDMLLFESHSVIHGHPFPLKGRFYAMLFIHFEPTGQSLLHDATGYHHTGEVDRQYRDSVKEGVGGQSSSADAGRLPPYIKRESPEEEIWKKMHPEGWTPPAQILPPEAHIAAKAGQIEKLEKELSSDNAEKVLTERDENGWQVLHQGVASGNKDVVELLVDKGAEINARTHGGYGETPLRIAEKQLSGSHPIVQYLKSLGALSLGPEL